MQASVERGIVVNTSHNNSFLYVLDSINIVGSDFSPAINNSSVMVAIFIANFKFVEKFSHAEAIHIFCIGAATVSATFIFAHTLQMLNILI